MNYIYFSFSKSYCEILRKRIFFQKVIAMIEKVIAETYFYIEKVIAKIAITNIAYSNYYENCSFFSDRIGQFDRYFDLRFFINNNK